MSESASHRSPRERQVDALILEYEQAAEQGVPPNRDDFLRQHAEFATELREYFDNCAHLREIAEPILRVLDETEPVSSSTRQDLMPGMNVRHLGDYEILDELGHGGMGTVYLANHTRLDKTVAIKILKADCERDSQAIARFEREMKAVGKLEHPNIVRALDARDEAGTHFLVMEFLEGCDLARLVKANGPLEVPLACELIRQAALGLQHAHDHQLVHRDVKPSNLLLSSTGQVKVLDLGLAQWQAIVGGDHNESCDGEIGVTKQLELTHKGQLVGTWRYMAPEQFMPSRQVDSRADIFSLGVTFYCLLVGELPIGPGQTAVYLPPIATQRPDVPPELQELFGRMLALNPEERVQTMLEVARELEIYARQGSLSIVSLSNRLGLHKSAGADALDGTASWSDTAEHGEVIPPPIPPSAQTHSPPQPPTPRPSAVERIKTRLADTPKLSLVAWSASSFAVLVMAVLVLVVLSSSVATTWDRRLAESRIGELKGITTRALEQWDENTVEACLQELVTLSNKFPHLLDKQTVNGFQETLDRGRHERQVAADLWRAIQEARDGRQWTLLANKLRAYLNNPHATEIDKAKGLLADVEYLLANEPNIPTRVANWSDATLDEFLRTAELPPTITIVDEVVRESFRANLLVMANLQSARRQVVPEPEPREPLNKGDDQRHLEDIAKRARRALLPPGDDLAQIQEAEAKSDWQLHPERHGLLGLIPQDAAGGVGVASVNHFMTSITGALREVRENQPALSNFVGPFVASLLKTPPFECYRQDQPLAIVFANPAKAGVVVQVEHVNPLSAMWDRDTLESLGVVVGTPIGDLNKVKENLKLPKGTILTGRILRTQLFYYQDVKQVYVLLRDGRLYVGFNAQAVRAVADSLQEHISVAMDMSPREAMRLMSMDLLLHFGPGAWRKEWLAAADEMRARLATDEQDQEAVGLANEFRTIMQSATSFLLGAKLDQGIHVSLLVRLSSNDNERLVHFEQLIGGGEEPLTLAGLPHDGATGAFATRGNGVSNAVIARSMLLPLNGLVSVSGVPLPAEQRITLTKAFREVWNEVAGTRAGYYGDAVPLVVLDTYGQDVFIDRLQKLVDVWDTVALELADGDQLKAGYRFAIDECEFDGRKAYQLSLVNPVPGGGLNEQFLIIPIGNQMVISLGGDQASLRQLLTNLSEEVPRLGLADNPGILAASQRLPPQRKMELYLWASGLQGKFMQNAELSPGGDAEYSAASLTLGRTSIGLDVWVPLGELIKLFSGRIGQFPDP